MNKNTYSLMFGKEPLQFISRSSQVAMITESFISEPVAQQIYLLTGLRGSGKTVMMNEIQHKMITKKDWIIVELSPERDMLEALASKLSSEKQLAQLFQSADINLSFFGFGLSVHNSVPITDIETALSKMLETLKKHGKKVLILVDEAVNNVYMKVFASTFQILIRQDLPLFLLMTGLYENIYALQNEKSLTFLYRAPKVEMKPLNLKMIAENYQKNFHLTDEDALEMARQTKGYSFAFQVLGYFTYEHNGNWKEAINAYKEYLFIYVYDKIWSELSGNDKRVIYGMAKSKDGKIKEIREFLKLETNQFNPYRIRLIRKGIIDGSVYGHVKFTLPYMEEFVIENYEQEQM